MPAPAPSGCSCGCSGVTSRAAPCYRHRALISSSIVSSTCGIWFGVAERFVVGRRGHQSEFLSAIGLVLEDSWPGHFQAHEQPRISRDARREDMLCAIAGGREGIPIHEIRRPLGTIGHPADGALCDVHAQAAAGNGGDRRCGGATQLRVRSERILDEVFRP